jgi:hypothetical protein
MGCEAGRGNGLAGPGEAIEAGSEWGERRAGRGDQAGSEWGAKRAAATDRAGPGEAIEAGSEWGARQHSSGAARGELAGFDNSILCTLRAAVNGVRGGPRERSGRGNGSGRPVNGVRGERRSRRAVNGVRGSGETRLRPGEGIEAGRGEGGT